MPPDHHARAGIKTPKRVGVVRVAENEHPPIGNRERTESFAEGRAPKAVEYLQSAYVIDPQPDTLDSLAVALAAAGQLEESARRFEELLKPKNVGNESQEQRLTAHVRLAEIYARLGRPDRARQLCDALLAQWKDGDDGLVLLKDAHKVLAGLK